MEKKDETMFYFQTYHSLFYCFKVESFLLAFHPSLCPFFLFPPLLVFFLCLSFLIFFLVFHSFIHSLCPPILSCILLHVLFVFLSPSQDPSFFPPLCLSFIPLSSVIHDAVCSLMLSNRPLKFCLLTALSSSFSLLPFVLFLYLFFPYFLCALCHFFSVSLVSFCPCLLNSFHPILPSFYFCLVSSSLSSICECVLPSVFLCYFPLFLLVRLRFMQTTFVKSGHRKKKKICHKLMVFNIYYLKMGNGLRSQGV